MEQGWPPRSLYSPGAAHTHTHTHTLFFFHPTVFRNRNWTWKSSCCWMDGWAGTTVAAVGPFSLFGLWCLWRNRLCVSLLFSLLLMESIGQKKKKRKEHNRKKKRFLYNIKGIIIKTNNNLKNSNPSSSAASSLVFFFFLFEHTFSHVIIDCPVLYGPAHLMCTMGQGKGAPNHPPPTMMGGDVRGP